MFGINRRKRDVFDTLFGRGADLARQEFTPQPVAPAAPSAATPAAAEPTADMGRGDVVAGSVVEAPVHYRWQDGDKFPGGFGPTQLLTADYWTLRARSVQLFEENHYARGVIRRLLTNVINSGLHLEAIPEESILGYPADGLADWSEETETKFNLWGSEPNICDFAERSTFGSLQAQAFTEALIAGDVLVVLRQDQRTKLPRIQLISGARVQTPFLSSGSHNGNRIVHGVELDANDRHVAYWVTQKDGEPKRLPAYGEKSGRRLAWLAYATEKRLDDVRGKPILALILQSLREIDRYRDNLQRKAVINSILAMFIKKELPVRSSRGMTSGAVGRGVHKTVDSAGDARRFRTQEYVPGLVIEELNAGETPQSFQTTGTTEEFGKFEEALVQSVAWHLEIPPEILQLSFSSNYSASQAAVYEFKLYLNKAHTAWAECFCQPIYAEWLYAAVLAKRIVAPGLVESWRDYTKSDTYSAWMSSDWAGQIKPAVDPVKVMRAATEALNEGLTTRARLCREYFGMKFSKVAPQLARENVMLAEARRPLLALEASLKPTPQLPPPGGSKSPPEEEGDDDTNDEDAKELVN